MRGLQVTGLAVLAVSANLISALPAKAGILTFGGQYESSLPAATFQLTVDYGGASYSGSTSTPIEINGNDAVPHIIPTPSVASSSYLLPNSFSGTGVGSEADLQYSFAVVGPSTSNVWVPITLSGVSYSSMSGSNIGGNASAYLGLTAAGGFNDTGQTSIPVYGSCMASDVAQCGPYPIGQSTFSTSVSVLANSEIAIGLFSHSTLQVYTSNYLGGGGSASSYIDPYIQIDPTWTATNPGYSLALSSGIGNSALSSIPEPDPVAIVSVGLLALAGLRRRVASVTTLADTPVLHPGTERFLRCASV